MDFVSGFLGMVQPQKDGDSYDKLSYFYSVVFITVCAVFTGGWSFVGYPIMCWFPAYYRQWWIEYACDYCYVQNTYFLPFTEEAPKNHWHMGAHQIQVPKNVTKREEGLIGYYQWVPFILILEALMFYLPAAIWRASYTATGVKVKELVEEMANPEHLAKEQRVTDVDKLSKFLEYSFENVTRIHKSWNPLRGRLLTALYLFTKFLFAINCVAQFFMMASFLGFDSILWGFTLTSDLFMGREWLQSGNFPRVTMCDFEVRVMGNLHRHTVQCTLIINMFNEKIFLFLYWWFLFVGILSVYSFIQWILIVIFDSTGRGIITGYLGAIDQGIHKSPRRREVVRDFINGALKSDGVMLLRLVAQNAGDGPAIELMEAMWNNYKRKYAPLGNGNRKQPNKEKVKLASSNSSSASNSPHPPSYDQSITAPILSQTDL